MVLEVGFRQGFRSVLRTYVVRKLAFELDGHYREGGREGGWVGGWAILACSHWR